MFSFLNILWLFRESKYFLFWLYLWQLKEYHIPRFIDHFSTHQGKKLIYNPLFFIKIGLILLLTANSSSYFLCAAVLFFCYIFESAIFIKNIAQRSIKKPVLTSKTILLIIICFTVLFFAFLNSIFMQGRQTSLAFLLIFDIFTPLIVSFIVLVIQPIFVFARRNILKRAKQKVAGMKNLTIIGITGSYGKTSTKEFLSAILSEKFNVLATEEHKNSEMGIAQTILHDLHPEHQVFIVEMGAYRKGGIKLLCDMAPPKIGIVTGVNEQHLALFGSLENLLSAEGGKELAEALPQDGTLILNGDNKHCLNLYKKSSFLNKKIYTENKGILNSDIWTEEKEVLRDHISFMAINKNREMAHFNVSVLGGQNIQNLLASILAAREMGMDFEEISKAGRNIKQEQAGMVLKQGKHGIAIIDSSYSANPDGVYADIDYLGIFPNKKAIIMPCLIELGDRSAEIHQKIGRKIGRMCDLAIITTKDRFSDIEKGFNETKKAKAKCLLCDKPGEIAMAVSLFCKSGDAVLLEGRIPPKLHELL